MGILSLQRIASNLCWQIVVCQENASARISSYKKDYYFGFVGLGLSCLLWVYCYEAYYLYLRLSFGGIGIG